MMTPSSVSSFLKNLHRRDLDTSQRAMIAAELANQSSRGDRPSDQAATLPLVSQGEAARLMNVSPRSVRDAVLVENDGDSELVTAIKKGRQHSRRIVESIREIGDKLVQTKAKLPDGSFSPWLESALGWSIEHARRFIEVRDRLNDGDAEELGVIDLSALRIAASFAGDQLVKPAEEAEPGIQAAR